MQELDRLRDLADPERAARASARHKRDRETLGITPAALEEVVAEWRAERDLDARIALAEALWTSDIHEARLAAARLLVQARMRPDDAAWAAIMDWAPQIDGAEIDDAVMTAAAPSRGRRSDPPGSDHGMGRQPEPVAAPGVMLATLPWAKMNNPKPEDLEIRGKGSAADAAPGVRPSRRRASGGQAVAAQPGKARPGPRRRLAQRPPKRWSRPNRSLNPRPRTRRNPTTRPALTAIRSGRLPASAGRSAGTPSSCSAGSEHLAARARSRQGAATRPAPTCLWRGSRCAPAPAHRPGASSSRTHPRTGCQAIRRRAKPRLGRRRSLGGGFALFGRRGVQLCGCRACRGPGAGRARHGRRGPRSGPPSPWALRAGFIVAAIWVHPASDRPRTARGIRRIGVSFDHRCRRLVTQAWQGPPPDPRIPAL
ncbi:hypothetical protein F1642_02965 [Paracoccus sp. NBH48]|nr:hypothetical protein [Paracoccus sp. NBH48]